MENNRSVAFTGMVDLVSEKIGGKTISASDEFFAEKENLLKPGRGVYISDKYTDRGKWMDGWETRRRRTPGNDWCIIKMGLPGVVRGVDIDTNHFLGNNPAYASVDAIRLDDVEDESSLDNHEGWTEILPRNPLAAGSQNLFGVGSEKSWTHLRLNIYPDGGVARFRAFGLVTPRLQSIAGDELDVVAMENGGRAVACSDMFFSPMENLIMPGDARNMGEGWESRRRRGPGNDWVILKTAHAAYINRILVDTNYFKGNYPDYCSFDACYAPDLDIDLMNWPDLEWEPIMEKQKLNGHHKHIFKDELKSSGPYTHIRLNIYPDGGISRLRIYGKFVSMTLDELNNLTDEEAINRLLLCCGSHRWAREMVEQRPFQSKNQLMELAETIWDNLSKEDWLEAFSHHPKIGDLDSLRKKYATTRTWAESEQSGTKKASDETLHKLKHLNEEYEEKYGYIFIVCATGKSADEMLQILEGRIGNAPEKELDIAAGEQKKITKIRLEKLLT